MTWLAAVLLQAMLAWVPPSEGDLDRYAAIAVDIVAVAEEYPVFSGAEGTLKTAFTLAAIGSYESLFRNDVDAFEARGDGGKAWGLLQVHLRSGETCDSRLACLRIGRERLRESFHDCRRLPEQDRLSKYTTGRCMHNRESRVRMERAARGWRSSLPRRPTVF